MAKVTLPLHSEYASGKVSCIEFKNGRSGPMVGRRSRGTPTSTQPQQAARRLWDRLHFDWRNLSDNTRLQYAAVAAPPRSGWQEYVSRFIPLQFWDQDFTPSPEPTNASCTITPLLPYYSASTPPPQHFQWIVEATGDVVLVIDWQPLSSPGATIQSNRWRVIAADWAYMADTYADIDSFHQFMAVRFRAYDANTGVRLGVCNIQGENVAIS